MPVTSVLDSSAVVEQAGCVPMPDLVGEEEVPAMVAHKPARPGLARG
ncbi:MAG: hypothetical protein R2715_02715 [Ilumatobacteraceae bacterium]